MSKSYRLVEIAREVFAAAPGVAIELLDLSRLASEYGRHIHPCKACFSTAAALCHWPCSCYPNYSLGQTQDWMNEIYPMWVAAHGVMIITPVKETSISGQRPSITHHGRPCIWERCGGLRIRIGRNRSHARRNAAARGGFAIGRNKKGNVVLRLLRNALRRVVDHSAGRRCWIDRFR
jgi:NADPH-dependent FMN reductase